MLRSCTHFRSLIRAAIGFWLTLFCFHTDASARVARIEIIEWKPFADSPMPFGDVGPYEYIRGRLHYAVSH